MTMASDHANDNGYWQWKMLASGIITMTIGTAYYCILCLDSLHDFFGVSNFFHT